MEILKCGLEVELKNTKIIAIITACCIRFDKVNYEVSYFNGLEYKSIWVNEKEFNAENKLTDKLGYKN